MIEDPENPPGQAPSGQAPSGLSPSGSPSGASRLGASVGASSGAAVAPKEQPSPELAAKDAELRELRARVHQLEQTLQEMRIRHLTDLKTLRQSQHLLNAVLENSPSLIYVKDSAGRYILVNRRVEVAAGRSRAEIMGKTDAEIFPAELAARITDSDRQVLSSDKPIEYEEQRTDEAGRTLDYFTVKFQLTDASGAITGVCGLSTDITDRKRATEERTKLQQQVIDAQRATLRELSSPLIPLADGVLAMPLIGSIDQDRAREILETLLEGVARQRAKVAILDITGVRLVDTHVAQALLQAARAVRLLGAHVILTGIRPEVAQTLVHIGADLSSLTTRSTLQSGIAYALTLSGPGSASKA